MFRCIKIGGFSPVKIYMDKFGTKIRPRKIEKGKKFVAE